MKNNWIVKNLEDVCEILDNKRKPISDKVRQNMKGNIPYYGANGQVGWINDFLLDDKLILLAEDGGNYLDPFKPNAYVIEGKAWVNNHAHVIKNKSEIIDFNWLFYVLAWSDIKSYVSGTTRLKLNQTRMREIPIPLPPLQEQKQIVSKIKECFTLLDKSEEKLKQKKVSLDLAKESFLTKALLGKLTTLKDSRISSIEIVLEELPQLPKSWMWQKIGAISKVSSSKRIFAQEYLKQGVPFYRSKEIGELEKGINVSTEIYISQEKFDEIKQKYGTPKEESLLVTCVGTIGNVWKVDHRDFYYKDGNIVCIECDRTMNPDFLKYFIKSKLFTRQVTDIVSGTAYNALTIIKFKNLFVPLPSLNEQQEIVLLLEKSLKSINNSITLIDTLLIKLQTLRQSILKKAFEGKLI